jgi:hypothetical protein
VKKLEKRVSAVLVAAGSSTRMGFDKLSFDLGGETVLHRSIRAFEQDPLVTEIVLVAGKNRAFVEQQAADCTKPVQIVTGGTTRAESAKNGVLAAAGELVAVHDAARRQSGRYHSSAGSSGPVRRSCTCCTGKGYHQGCSARQRKDRAGCLPCVHNARPQHPVCGADPSVL